MRSRVVAVRGERQGSGDSEGGWGERAAAVVDGSLPPARLPRELMLEAFQHARECYPEECCGLLIGPEESATPCRFVRCTNVQSQRRSKGESDLDARHAFWIDEQELLHALRSAEEGGEALRVVYHSHIDTPAYLSHADLQSALGPDGLPLWPAVEHLVISVQEDGVQGGVLFGWDPETESFVGRRVQEAG